MDRQPGGRITLEMEMLTVKLDVTEGESLESTDDRVRVSSFV